MPIIANLPSINLPLDIGAAIAIPSVVLCKANPTIKNVLNAIEPIPTAAPMANLHQNYVTQFNRNHQSNCNRF